MKKTRTLLCLAAAALMPAAASASTTIVDFNSAITAYGPGSMSNFGGLATGFNTVSGFGLNAMAGGDKGVMSFAAAAAANANGLQFTHATTSPNTTGYSILMDVYFATIPDYLSLLQLNTSAPGAGGDGDLFGRGAGGIGISSDYDGTGFTANAWHRLVLTVAPGALNIYVDGTLANTVTPSAADRYDISEPSFLLFADEDNETAPGYISQFGFQDSVLDASTVGALGGANASLVPEPAAAGLAATAALGLMIRRRRTA